MSGKQLEYRPVVVCDKANGCNWQTGGMCNLAWPNLEDDQECDTICESFTPISSPGRSAGHEEEE